MEELTMDLKVSNLYKRFGALELFSDFSTGFPVGVITCILGPSGCGKSTLLNMLGGLTQPDHGELSGFDGRRLSYIFQEARLLPWKSVEENIAFAADSGLDANGRLQLARRLIRLVGLDGFERYYPGQLSGGMRQRVSIARAFAAPSDIILMDEPLKGLDPALKQTMIGWFILLWKADPRTVIFVTHDVEEALLLGSRILVLSPPPATIVTRFRVDESPGTRSASSETLQPVRTALEKALGLKK